MKKSKVVLIILGVIVLLLVMSISSYNSIVGSSEEVERSLGEIDNQLQRRNELVPNLVSTVKQYAAHEEDIFTEVADARATLLGAGSLSEQAEGDAALSGALGRLLAISEAYPILKANENFINLQDELAGTENRIVNSRMDYNNGVNFFNSSIRKFPMNIFASIFGFEKYDYFEASEAARNNPDVGDLFEE